MSLTAKLIVSGCVLAVLLPLAVMVARRMLRGEPFDKSTTGLIPPPSGPPLGGGA